MPPGSIRVACFAWSATHVSDISFIVFDGLLLTSFFLLLSELWIGGVLAKCMT